MNIVCSKYKIKQEVDRGLKKKTLICWVYLEKSNYSELNFICMQEDFQGS